MKNNFIALLFILLLAGCQSYVNVDVDAICAPVAREKYHYILIPGDENCSSQDLQFLEFADLTDKVLQCSGFIKVPCEEEADVAILLSYDIGDPQAFQESYTLPIWGQTGGCCSDYGIIGASNHVTTSFIFLRRLTLLGIEPLSSRQKNRQIGIWSTTATSLGKSDDLRKIFPYLLGAAKEHIATNTCGKIPYKIKVTDKGVKGNPNY